MEALENANNCNNSESDHSESHSPCSPKLCYGCKNPIEDEYRLCVTPDLQWHASCLVCSECHTNLDESCTCFLKEGRPYCKKDYVRLFGIKCTLCLHPISGTDNVMRAENLVYHTSCFHCSSCEKPLKHGEEFGLSYDRKLFCKIDFELHLETLDSPTDTSEPMSVDNDNDSNSTENSTSNSTRNNSTSSGGSHKSGTLAKRSNSDKGPRVRTVLSEQQLSTLRAVYTSNPRPDALMKEHLVELTGLHPKVIRVWFQNKRCKDKKKLKAIQHEATRLQQGSNAVLPPLTPQTPLTPDSMGQISPHPGITAFTYPPDPGNYDAIPSTPTQTAVSPIVTFQQNLAWASPTTSIPHFDPNVDFSSPISTADQPSVVYSTTITSLQNYYN